MATPVIAKSKPAGGTFLVQEHALQEIFTPEDITEEHLQIAQRARDFAQSEVLPQRAQVEAKNFAVTRDLIRKACEAGLGIVYVPQEFGGTSAGRISSALIAENLSLSGSFDTAFRAHTTLGSLPIACFGSSEVKAKYLPRLSHGEWVAAYALSEDEAGSDVMDIRATATLSPDQSEWILNGEKAWVTNGSFADLFVVFAKIDGQKPSAFIVERTASGLRTGTEQKTLGLRGASNCQVLLENCRIPKENLLGEIGKGHNIAFSVLNLARLESGFACIGSAKNILDEVIPFAGQRRVFGKSLAAFGLIREKIANMAIGIYVAEAMAYRTAGMLDAVLTEIDPAAPDFSAQLSKGIDQYAVECSIIKTWTSELLSYVADEGVQIYGSRGLLEDHPAERACRDARMVRIMAGTSEINRLVITGWLLKRSMTGQLMLMPVMKKLGIEIMAQISDPPLEGTLAVERTVLANAKKAVLLMATAASQKYLMAIVDQQEIIVGLADMLAETYALDSAIRRTHKLIEAQGEDKANLAVWMTRMCLAHAIDKIQSVAHKIAAAAAEDELLQTLLANTDHFCKYQPYNTIELRTRIANHVVQAGKYTSQ